MNDTRSELFGGFDVESGFIRGGEGGGGIYGPPSSKFAWVHFNRFVKFSF